MAKATPPTELQSTFALFNLCNTAIGTIDAYKNKRGNTSMGDRMVQTQRLKKLPTTLASALKRRPNTPLALRDLINLAIYSYRYAGASQATLSRLQDAVDWARTYLQENTTRTPSGYTLPPFSGKPQ